MPLPAAAWHGRTIQAEGGAIMGTVVYESAPKHNHKLIKMQSGLCQ
jgi:hypothetical protein